MLGSVAQTDNSEVSRISQEIPSRECPHKSAAAGNEDKLGGAPGMIRPHC